jgi:hypothetical protein
MIEVMRQVRNALVWNLNTDLDNIPACEQWSEMLRKNIDALDKAMADAELKWVGLTDEEMLTLEETTTCTKDESWLRNLTQAIEAKLKEKNT